MIPVEARIAKKYSKIAIAVLVVLAAVVRILATDCNRLAAGQWWVIPNPGSKSIFLGRNWHSCCGRGNQCGLWSVLVVAKQCNSNNSAGGSGSTNSNSTRSNSLLGCGSHCCTAVVY